MIRPNGDGWTMPPALEPYRDFMGHGGKQSVEELMDLASDSTLFTSNLSMWIRVQCVQAQVGMLLDLQQKGLLGAKPRKK
jgi:hypothetical protein